MRVLLWGFWRDKGASVFSGKCTYYTLLAAIRGLWEPAMTDFCVLRTAKLKTFGSIAGSGKHTFRETPTPNADAARTHLNQTLGAKTSAKLRAAVKAVLPAKRRKDAVLCIEYLIAASPEWFSTTTRERRDTYWNDAIKWLRKKHGTKNVVCINLQLDEKSPHLVAYVVPNLPDGRLSAKEFLGGRKKLQDLQTCFWEQVARGVGLNRGLKGSSAKHISAKAYSAALAKNPTLVAPAPPALTLGDRLTGHAKQAMEKHEREMAEFARLVEQAQSVALQAKRARTQYSSDLAALRAENEKLRAYQVKTRQMEAENKRLQQELDLRRKESTSEIVDLQNQLAASGESVKKLSRENRALIAEAEDLTAQIDELYGLPIPSVFNSMQLS